VALELLDNLTLADFERMADLEARAYSDDFIAPAQEAYAWYRRYPYTVVVLACANAGAPAGDERRIAGFINMFPVTDEVFEGLRAGTFNDADLTVDQIVDIELAGDGPLHMFLSCIAVDEAYRGHGVAGALVRAAAARYEHVAHRVDWIVTDNVTPGGERFSQNLGFDFVRTSDHGSAIYLQEYASFVRRLQQAPRADALG